jgi:hypothetical protein
MVFSEKFEDGTKKNVRLKPAGPGTPVAGILKLFELVMKDDIGEYYGSIPRFFIASIKAS